MNLILFDDPSIRLDLSPFALTRPTSEIRVGILTIREKWEQVFQTTASFLTEDYLSKKFPFNTTSENVFINGALCPDTGLVEKIKVLKPNEVIYYQNTPVAACGEDFEVLLQSGKKIDYNESVVLVDQVWKIFQYNGDQIRKDFELITRGKNSAKIADPHTIVYGTIGKDLFIEDGAMIKASVLNAENGPIYIGKHAQIQEGAVIRGPFALCEDSVVNMGAKVKGDTTVGPHSKVGGEVSNAVIFGFSNKAHDGFLGNSVIGEWCNLGADTNTSNLKNNYENVKIWSYKKNGFKDTGLQFCGLMMGDHSKCGINTMFNTGTVVGVGSNIFGDGFPRTFIPSFAWGGASGFTTFQLNKMIETAEKVMARRSKKLEQEDRNILKHIFDNTAGNRVWEKKN